MTNLSLKGAIYLLSIFLLALLCFCSPTNNKLTSSDVGITLQFANQDSTVNGKWFYVFFGDLYLINKGGGISNSTFSDAKAWINGEQIPMVVSYGDYYRFEKEFYLLPGDTMRLTLQHELFGTIKDTIIVPSPIKNVTIDSSNLDHFVIGNIDSFQVSWDSSNCNFYQVTMQTYDSSWNRFGVQTVQTPNCTILIKRNDWNWQTVLAGPIKHLKISIYSLNEKDHMDNLGEYSYSVPSEYGTYATSQ